MKNNANPLLSPLFEKKKQPSYNFVSRTSDKENGEQKRKTEMK